MKKFLSFILVLTQIFCLCACAGTADDPVSGNAGVSSDSGNSSQDTPADDEDTPDEDEITDTYVGSFYRKGGGAHIGHMVTASGTVERLEEVYGTLSYTKDGQFVVWRDNTEVYKKQPGKAQVTLSTNADSFYLNHETGLLIVFCEDGVYAAAHVSEELQKVSDLADSVYRMDLSDDGSCLAYIAGGGLYLIDLTTFAVSKLVDSDVDHGEYLICCSASEIYFETFENVRSCWDGTSVLEKYVPESVEDEYECKSPNKQYAIGKENGVYYRYKIADGNVIEKTELGKAYGLFFVSDDGIAGVFSNGTITVYTGSTTYELTGQLCGYYYPAYPPCLDGVLYYKDGTSLMGFDLSTGTSSVIAENVSNYHVLNGYCYYVTTDEDLYRLGISEPISRYPIYMNATGFMY